MNTVISPFSCDPYGPPGGQSSPSCASGIFLFDAPVGPDSSFSPRHRYWVECLLGYLTTNGSRKDSVHGSRSPFQAWLENSSKFLGPAASPGPLSSNTFRFGTMGSATIRNQPISCLITTAF